MTGIRFPAIAPSAGRDSSITPLGLPRGKPAPRPHTTDARATGRRVSFVRARANQRARIDARKLCASSFAVEMDRTPSADDLMASFLWRTAHHAGGTPGMGFGAPGHGGANAVVRTPSQNEMESYYNAMMASAVTGGSSGSLGQDNLIAHVGGGGPPSREGTPGIPRVASIDVLRKMIMSGGLPSGGAGGSGSPGSMTPTTAAGTRARARKGWTRRANRSLSLSLSLSVARASMDSFACVPRMMSD